MRKIILIGGDLASGKSTYSKFLKEELKIGLINKDNLKEMCGDVFYCETREENKKLSVLSFKFIKYLLNSTFEDLIIESNFKEYEMEELKELLKDDQVLSLKFTGDNLLLHKRFLDRLNGPRHYVHRAEDFTNIDDFVRMLEGLRKVEYIGEVINVKVDDRLLTSDSELLNQIKEFINK